MAKFKVLGRFPADRIPFLVPPEYRGRARMGLDPDAEYTVVLFDHDRERSGVATSAVARRALGRVGDAEPVLAVGVDFTVEATALLEDHGVTIIRIGTFGWTDESWRSRIR